MSKHHDSHPDEGARLYRGRFIGPTRAKCGCYVRYWVQTFSHGWPRKRQRLPREVSSERTRAHLGTIRSDMAW